ncbi:MAG: hypothetical protein B7X54_05710 [Idiomarina sp. 34-48-12]|nr:MAG: hypothetical protein B7X54_05710 [Idiomarina sp. 34-48-12]
MKRIVILLSLTALSACTSIQVEPLPVSMKPEKICIERNPKVIVGDFLTVVRNRIEFHGIDTEVYERGDHGNCDFTMTYTALKNWDLGTYMHHAELRLEYNGRKIGYAEYHLNGKGGLSLSKWQSTKSKMEPVVDRLLGK